jgi:hypothetical protein
VHRCRYRYLTECPGRNRDSQDQSIFIVLLLPVEQWIGTGKGKPEEVRFEIGLSMAQGGLMDAKEYKEIG